MPVADGLAPRPLDLGDPRLRRLIVRLALPTVAGLGIGALHHVANAFFVGQLGAAELAAVSVAIPVFVAVAAIGEGLGVGAAAAIGRQLGAGTPDHASSTATTTLALAVGLGLALSLVLLLAAGPLLTVLGATPKVLPLASRYVVILGLSCALLLAQQLCDFIAIAEGNTRFSMLTLLGAFTLNIVLDPILIFGVGLGIAGAALATIMSQIAALLLFAVYFGRRWGVVRIGLDLLRPSARILGPVLQVGVPAMLSTVLGALALALTYHAAASYGGDEALAGVGVALRLLALGTLPVIGFCLGAQPVLSFACGARNHPRLLVATRYMLVVTSAGAAAYALVMVLLAGPVTALFTADAAAQAVAARACRMVHAGFALVGLQFVLIVLLQAMGKGWTAALVGLTAQGGLLIPALLVLPRWWGLDGVIAAQPVAAGLASLLAAALLRHEARALRQPSGGMAIGMGLAPPPHEDWPDNARPHRVS